jgi:hypothetical protein
MAKSTNCYTQIIEAIFFAHYREGDTQVAFQRSEINETANRLGLGQISNVGDDVYSFRFRTELPERVKATATAGSEWIIRQAGIGHYVFVLSGLANITPNEHLVVTKIPDATPGVISTYALDDEQALLAKLRYNRLIDIFVGITCYSLQNHLRTTVPDMGQIEIDELYIGLDSRGAHYVLPVQAKGGKDKLSIVQIEQDIAWCKQRFPHLLYRPIAAQFMTDDVIALFEFEETDDGIGITAEKHYRLVASNELTAEELARYRARTF